MPNKPKSTHPGGHSSQYEAHAQAIDGKPWKTPHPYVEGVRVTWEGVRLVCTRGHYCGDSAWHPWDPGSGWAPEHAATLWAPDGPDEDRKLRELLPRVAELEDVEGANGIGSYRRGLRDDERGYLGFVLLHVTGGVP